MEIGSFYEIDPAAVGSGNQMAQQSPELFEIKKYGKKYCGFAASGRGAIALALKNIEEKRPDLPKRCLMPAYMCDSVFLPFLHADWEIFFYHVDQNLETDREDLKRRVEETAPGLIFVHCYYGADTCKPIRPFLRECREKGICVMEDVTQSYYLNEAGREADYVVGSLRKWYPVPDGGFVVSDEELTEEEPGSGGFFTEKRLEYQQEKWRYLHEQADPSKKREMKADFLQKNREMEDWLDQHTDIGEMSAQTAGILRTVKEEECRKKRSENYGYLCQRLENKTQFRPILSVRESGAAPLYLAVYAKDRRKLQDFLRENDIYAPVLWPVGKENEACLTAQERYIYEHMLALPMDQRYGQKEMERVAEVMEEFEKRETAERIGIRADANEVVATGHIMRCITIAKQLIACGKRVLFFIADEYAQEFLEQAGLEYVCLHTAWDRMEEETKILCRQLEKSGCKKLLVDSYQVTKPYFEKLKESCKLAYIDDCFEDVYPVDMLINYNAYHVRFPYEETYAGRTRLLLGTSYVPLREEFAQERSAEREDNKLHVLLAAGGGDRYHALHGIFSELLETAGQSEMEQVVFHAVLGRFFEGKEELEQLAARHSNIRLHCSVNNMAELMGQCDAAVSAAGTMLFELSAMQVPAVFFVSADNQQYDREFFEKENRMLFAGDIRRDREGCLKQIRICLQKLLEDEDLRGKMRTSLRKVTDGRGARRIAAEIADL